MAGFDQFDRDRWAPRFLWIARRTAHEWFPNLAAAALEMAAGAMAAPDIPFLFARDLREIPPHLNDELLDLFGRSEQTLANRFTFHNHGEKFGQEIAWASDADPAWLAELHAFDYGLDLALNFRITAEGRYARHLRYLIAHWISANPPGKGAGWRLGPLARRMHNWILAADLARADWECDSAFFKIVATSLALQSSFLRLHANSAADFDEAGDCARALILAGKFFGGHRGDDLCLAGEGLLLDEIEKYFGASDCRGHHSPRRESSTGVPPMLPQTRGQSHGRDTRGAKAHLRPSSQMHLASTIVEFLLFHPERSDAQTIYLKENLSEILGELEGVLLPDGTLPLFGSSANFGGEELADLWALSAALLNDARWKALSDKFGVMPYLWLGEAGKTKYDALAPSPWRPKTSLPSHHEIYRLSGHDSSALIINGEASRSKLDHQDGLSYELSMYGQRVIVDSGAFAPPGGRLDPYFAGPHAHNVLLVDGEGACGDRMTEMIQSEQPSTAGETATSLHFISRGFSSRCVGHQRGFLLRGDKIWMILDSLQGAGNHSVISLIHFYPTFEIAAHTDRAVVHSRSLTLSVIPLGRAAPQIGVSRGDDQQFPGWYAPEFGVKYAASVLRLEWNHLLLPWAGGYLIAPGDVESGTAGELLSKAEEVISSFPAFRLPARNEAR